MLSEKEIYFEMISDDGISDQAKALYLHGEEMRIKEKCKEAIMRLSFLNKSMYVQFLENVLYTNCVT